MNKKKILNLFLALIVTFCLGILKVNAENYGTGANDYRLEFKNEGGFEVSNMTINEIPYKFSDQDHYFIDGTTLIVEFEAAPKDGNIPATSWCGDECGTHFADTMQLLDNGNYKFVVTITDPEQDFVTFSLVVDEFAPTGGTGVCYIYYDTMGGDPIESATFDCGSIPPRADEALLHKGDLMFAGWYGDEYLNNLYLFDHAEDSNVTVYAKWDEGEPTYRVRYEFNGAHNKNGDGGIEIQSVAFVPFITSENFIDRMEVIPPEGYTLKYIDINGKRYEVDKDEYYELNKDTTYTYIWVDADGNELVVNNGEKVPVEISTEGGMTVTFEGEEGEEYNLSVVDVLKITPEMLEALNVTEEEYNAIKETIIKSTKEYGDLLNVFVIEVDHRGQQYKGEVNFKVKMTDEMKKYNKFRFIYVDENNNFKVGEVVDVKIDGEYITGTLPHLSVYALVGSYEENSNNPKTSDNVIINLIMLVVSLSGLAGGIVYYKKRLAKNN